MKKRYYVLITIFLLIAFCVVWNIYDNQRFVVTEQTVTLDDLPNSFDGYRILQISDLHGKYFGENQLDLLSAINQLDYDCILFTGDMDCCSLLFRSCMWNIHTWKRARKLMNPIKISLAD